MIRSAPATSEALVQAELMLPHELDAALAVRSVVYVPLGSIEYHSRHLPVGLDGLNAHGVCIAAAGRTGGVVLPPLWFGTGGSHTRYPWTIMTATQSPLRELLDTVLCRLQDLDVELIVLFTGHFADEQLDLIDTVAREWNESGHRSRALPLAVNRTDATIAADHAGVFETTLLAALWPDRVFLDRLPDLSEAPIDQPIDGSFEHRHDPGHPLWGVMGPDPRASDLSTAGRLLDEVVGWTVAQVDSVLTAREGTD